MRLAAVLVSVTLSLSAASSAQCQTLSPLPGHPASSWAGAANRWELTPYTAVGSDHVSVSLRSARNEYWQSRLVPNAMFPDTLSKNPIYLSTSPAAEMDSRMAPEFPRSSDDTWVIATFSAYRVVEARPNAFEFYTEITFTVDSVLSDAGNSGLSGGSSFDVDRPGGKLKTESGKIISYDLKPARWSVAPGGTYLLRLVPGGPPSTFLISKAWDLSSGIVVPMSAQEEQRTKRGESSIAGLTVSQLKTILSQRF